MDEKIRNHPDYETGYADALSGRKPPRESSLQYKAGRDAGQFARDAFARAGFVQDSEGGFSMEMTLRAGT